ncbi:homocysteine S-methyltransferase family protein [Flagellimonas sp. 2504JD4-2]
MKTNIILTDGGLETDIIFNHNIDLEHFAAFPLVETDSGRVILEKYYRDYLELSKNNGTGFILESPTWRANLDWGRQLGYTEEQLIVSNKKAIAFMEELRGTYKTSVPEIKISGQLGPRGDGYKVHDVMTYSEAAKYHELQVKAFKEAQVDMVTAITMTYSEEALGIVKAAQLYEAPVVVSFTVEVDGRLPSGENLEEVITKLDWITDSYPLYYMINCAHPTHFIHLFETDAIWKNRIHGLRANASCKSHAELDEATELDRGNETELGQLHTRLQELLPNLRVFGGCCGTDISHIREIYSALRTNNKSLFTEEGVLVPMCETLIVAAEKAPKCSC